MKLPHLSLVLWDDPTSKLIEDKLESYIDHVEDDSGDFSCSKVYINLEIKKGLPAAIQLKVGDLSHNQALDYEHPPFKSNFYYVCGHFLKNFPSQEYHNFLSKITQKREAPNKTLII